MTDEILKLTGKFTGEGINQEGQKFVGTFEVSPLKSPVGLSFSFQAKGLDGESYHEERSLLGMGVDGLLSLWVLSSNHPGVFEIKLKSSQKSLTGTQYIFGFGYRLDRNSFREEILLEVSDKSVRYVYSWGTTGGVFAERSGWLMHRAPAAE